MLRPPAAKDLRAAEPTALNNPVNSQAGSLQPVFSLMTRTRFCAASCKAILLRTTAFTAHSTPSFFSSANFFQAKTAGAVPNCYF